MCNVTRYFVGGVTVRVRAHSPCFGGLACGNSSSRRFSAAIRPLSESLWQAGRWPQSPKSAIERHLGFAQSSGVHEPISTSEFAAVSTPPPRNNSLRYSHEPHHANPWIGRSTSLLWDAAALIRRMPLVWCAQSGFQSPVDPFSRCSISRFDRPANSSARAWWRPAARQWLGSASSSQAGSGVVKAPLTCWPCAAHC